MDIEINSVISRSNLDATFDVQSNAFGDIELEIKDRKGVAIDLNLNKEDAINLAHRLLLAALNQ